MVRTRQEYDDEELRLMFNLERRMYTPKKIASEMGRSPKAVRMRMRREENPNVSSDSKSKLENKQNLSDVLTLLINYRSNTIDGLQTMIKDLYDVSIYSNTIRAILEEHKCTGLFLQGGNYYRINRSNDIASWYIEVLLDEEEQFSTYKKDPDLIRPIKDSYYKNGQD